MLRRGLEVGSVIAGRRLESEIGRGGMGIVFRARNERLDRVEAVKVITDELAKDRSFRERFLREAMISIAVEHPHVIPVYDADEGAGGNLFIAMRYVEDGHNLARLIRQRERLEPRLAAQIVSDIASALDAAHSRDLVHRDVKPTNVLIVGGGNPHAYLTDFGLSKRISSHTMLSGTGSMIGTVDYMSPEQAQGQEVDVRTDIYALGVTLFEALTGRVPFLHETNQSRLLAKIQEPPPMVTQVASGIPSEFDAVLARALARDPSQRYPSAGELGRAAQAAAGRPSAVATKREITVGSVIADCVIESVAGEGGMAVVYKARQQNLDRTVALKVMSPGLADRSDFRSRFEREWKVAAALEHPNVVPIMWAGEAHGRLYIVMRFIEGETLRERLAACGRLEPGLAVEVLEQIAGALEMAHARGLVHRDVKPGNILIEGASGKVFLTDFGLAKLVDGDDDITDVSGRVIGTARYVPPERHHDPDADETLGDIYSLGCVLWDMLGGMERPRLQSVEGVPPQLRAVVERATSYDPALRFPSVGELERAARAAIAEGASDAESGETPVETEQAGAAGPRPHLSRAPERRQPFEPAPLSSGLSRRVLTLCDSVQSTGGSFPSEVLADLQRVREQLVAPLRMELVGPGGAGRSTLINVLVGRRLSDGRSYAELAARVTFTYGAPERIKALSAGGERLERGLSAEGRLPAEVLEAAEPLERLDVVLPVDSLRTVSLALSSRSDRSPAAEVATPEEAQEADAFLIVVPADATESQLVAPFRETGSPRRFSAVNAALVLSKADQVGDEKLKAVLDRLSQVASHLVASIAPFNGLLGEIANADVALNEDIALFAEVANAASGTRAKLLKSEDAFASGAEMIPASDRARLLDRYGLVGLRSAVELADAGELTGVGMRRRFRELSGFSAVDQAMDGFHARGDALRADRALQRLEDLSYRWSQLVFLRDHIEAVRLEPEMHLIDLIHAYERCVLDGVEVPEGLLTRLKRLITGRTPAQRFGLEEGSGGEELRAAALDGFRAWKMYENAGNGTPASRRVARRVARSYEHYARAEESVTG